MKRGRLLILVGVLVLSLISIASLMGCVAKSEYESLQTKYTTLQTDYEAVNKELNSLKEIYPPSDFSSITELEQWVSTHLQPSTPYLDGWARSALAVQAQGLKEGYLISVMYDENDLDPSEGLILCGALVNGQLYVWNPEKGRVYSWYADWFRR